MQLPYLLWRKETKIDIRDTTMSCLSLAYIYQWRSGKLFRLVNKKMGHDKDEDGFQLCGGLYFHLLACYAINRSRLFFHMRLTFIVLFR